MLTPKPVSLFVNMDALQHVMLTYYLHDNVHII